MREAPELRNTDATNRTRLAASGERLGDGVEGLVSNRGVQGGLAWQEVGPKCESSGISPTLPLFYQ